MFDATIVVSILGVCQQRLDWYERSLCESPFSQREADVCKLNYVKKKDPIMVVVVFLTSFHGSSSWFSTKYEILNQTLESRVSENFIYHLHPVPH